MKARRRVGPSFSALPPLCALSYISCMSPSDDDYLIRPDPHDPRLTERVAGVDQTGSRIETAVTVERALTIFLNAQEIVTAMTINDHPEYLALGYLLNQNMLKPNDVVTSVDYDEDLAVVVVRTKRKTNYEKKLKKKVQTSGCAQGTVFGDLMEALEDVNLPRSWRDPWLCARGEGPAAGLYGRCRQAQCRRQDCRLDVQAPRAGGRQDFLHHRPADLGNGDQDCAHGHSDPDLAVGLHRLGRRTGPQGQPDADRPRSRQALYRARGRGPDRVRSGPRLHRRRKCKAPAQSRGTRRLSAVDAPFPATLGLVLAGGLARRMGGGDKARIAIGGTTILHRVLDCLAPQCASLVINANGDPARFADAKLPVVADSVPGFAGPLAGILAGFDWAALHLPQCEWLASVPGDCPSLPNDLIPRLHAARLASGAPLACARSGEWRHPVIGLWPLALRDDLRRALVAEGLRKIEIWTARHGVAIADWPAEPVDPFFNVNTPEDAALAQTLAAKYPDAARLARK